MDSSPSQPPLPTQRPARALCPRCARAATVCICALAQPCTHHTQVLILQHPLEVQHPKGTARLLHLSLPHSRLLVGEHWDSEALHPWVHGSWPVPSDGTAHAWLPGATAAPPPQLTLLLYPPSSDDASLPLARPPDWDMQALTRLPPGAVVRLVVLDGTWRKSRKMLYLNPVLQHLPRLPLHTLPESHYHIRKAHKPGQLSTLEATAAALQQLEPQSTIQTSLMAAMQALQAHYDQLRQRPGASETTR